MSPFDAAFTSMICSEVRAVIRAELRLVRESTGVCPVESEFLTTTEGGVFARVAPKTIRKWVKQGKLKRYGEGPRNMIIRREELAALMLAGVSATQAEEVDDDKFAATLLAKAKRGA